MRLLVLGSAAGGGVPQWNCLCEVCRLAWAGDPRVQPRTQSSIAVSADGEQWVLLNASPDLRAQLDAAAPLSPLTNAAPTDKRRSPIAAVLLTNGDVDHIAGLLTLRERQELTVYATESVLGVLADNSVFAVLDPRHVRRQPIRLEEAVQPVAGLELSIFAVPGKVPLYLEGDNVEIGGESEMTVGVRVSANGANAYYIPGCASVTGDLKERVRDGDVILFDGTVYHDDEMQRAGVGEKTGSRMGHLSMAGESGSLQGWDGYAPVRKIFIHINNTNPVLVEGSPERATIEAAGWELAYDGMEIEL
ncbi:pyrroloquinoline quinone biosynthesis protein PqqB [Mangrovicella endophytica]|uniref:pyrroloquinoline quinone biosynthesis protein PqqB n=1 Tax=Mangrovicella endophytica TaxID=2066697 RepID=UPI000C9E7317|nr:pyrroloquinoline quinone biosynthesis protein PqqB [Mangrovicella endophytica]